MVLRIRVLPVTLLCVMLLSYLGAGGASATGGPGNGTAAYSPTPQSASTQTGAPSDTLGASAPSATGITATAAVTATPVASGATPAASTATPTVSGASTLSGTVTGTTAATSPVASATVAAPSGVSATLPLTPDTGTPVTSTIATLNAAPGVTTTAAAYGRLPLSFEPNQGQTDASVTFLSHGPGFNLYLRGTDATLTLVKPHARKPRRSVGHGHDLLSASALTQTVPISASVLRLHYAGANPNPRVVGEDQLPGVVNYLIGNDPNKWRTNIPTYARVAYTDVYPGVDLVYYGHIGQLEYDWVVQPGADAGKIALDVEGARGATIDADGNLVLQTAVGKVVQRAPVAYQDINGQRQPVATSYVLNGSAVGVTVGSYDATKPLIIDPVLSYGTYLGGSNDDFGMGIAVDNAGNAYATGFASSSDFPTTTGAYSTTNTSPPQAFVSKLNAAGTALIYSTYLGGGSYLYDQATYGQAIAVDSAGNAYVTRETMGTDFPTTPGAFQSTSPNGAESAFVTKLNAAGNALLYSTYLGGSTGNAGYGGDVGYGIAIDGFGDAYITGAATSTNFPTKNALQSMYGGGSNGDGDAFVTEVNPNGTALVFSTYLGGSSNDVGYAVALDSAGDIYVTGLTASADFPTHNALQVANGGGSSDAFVTKLDQSGGGWVYSTYLGGSDADQGWSIAADSNGDAYVTGDTKSNNFPTQRPLQGSIGGGMNGFVSALNPTGSALAFSTYQGSSGYNGCNAIALDGQSNVYVACGVTGGAQIDKLSPDGNSLIYQLLPVTGGTDVRGLAVDAAGSAYIMGSTYTLGVPTTPGSLQPSLQGGWDVFVAKIVGAASGTVPWHPHHGVAWHPHHGVRMSDGLGASVDLADGHIDVNVSDLSIPARGPSLGLRHVWDSTLAQGYITTTAGQGWSTNLTQSMGGVLTATVTFTDETGMTWPFTYSGPLTPTAGLYTAYSAPPGRPWQLITSNGGYTLTNFLSGAVTRFDAGGRYLSDADSYGNTDALSASSSGVQTWSNSGGRALRVSAYTSGLLGDAQSPPVAK